MSIKDYVVMSDKFEADIPEHGLDFPCFACKFRNGKYSEHPCNACGHNIMATKLDNE